MGWLRVMQTRNGWQLCQPLEIRVSGPLIAWQQDQKIVQPMKVKHQQHLIHAERIYFSMIDTQETIIVTGVHYPADVNFLILTDNSKARQLATSS